MGTESVDWLINKINEKKSSIIVYDLSDSLNTNGNEFGRLEFFKKKISACALQLVYHYPTNLIYTNTLDCQQIKKNSLFHFEYKDDGLYILFSSLASISTLFTLSPKRKRSYKTWLQHGSDPP